MESSSRRRIITGGQGRSIVASESGPQSSPSNRLPPAFLDGLSPAIAHGEPKAIAHGEPKAIATCWEYTVRFAQSSSVHAGGAFAAGIVITQALLCEEDRVQRG